MHNSKTRGVRWATMPLAVCLFLLIAASTAFALDAPWNGQPISHGMGPTYGETWPVPCPTSETYVYGTQGGSGGLALMPIEDIKAELDAWQAEATAAGVPARMTYSVIGQSAGGRDQYAVVINALETPAQQTAYANWQTIRAEELTNPAQALTDLASFGSNVKMAVLQCHIHGNEYEALDANMQEIRDLTVTPYGANPVVDKILDNDLVVFIIDENPDGRALSQRGNVTGLDPNRDYFVQSQPEQQNDSALMEKYLPTVSLEGHGYENPTLADGDTIPHNPGIDEDIFEHWNVQRVEQVRADFANDGLGAALNTIQSPIRDWNETGGTSTHNYTIAAAGVPGLHEAADGTVTVNFTPTTSLMGQGDKVVISGNADGYNGTYTVTSPNSLVNTGVFQCKLTSGPVLGLPDSGAGNVALPPQPNLAQSWDDWGPFYQQSFAALLGGPDSTTLEMTSSTAAPGRNWNSKTAQYLAFYSSNNYWADHKTGLMHDQVQIYLRGVTNAVPNPNAFADDPVLASRYFSDAWQNYMLTYPTAYIIPFDAHQRSDQEANNLVKWLLNNSVQVTRATADFSWNGVTYQAGSYVVWMNQALRGLAWNALSAGADVSGTKITTLYATPAVWSHGLGWGADVVEVPRGDASFTPATSLTTSANTLDGGIRGGVGAPSDWYSVTLKGVHEYPAIRSLLNSGIKGRMTETPFSSTTGGTMPAGTLIFLNSGAATRAALDAAGQSAGIWFERNVGVTMPPTTQVTRAPKIAYLVNAPATGTGQSQTTNTLDSIFGFDGTGNQQSISRLVTNRDWGYVNIADSTSAQGLDNPSSDPLAGYDIIYTTLTSWPATSASIATTANGGATESGNTATITTTAATGLSNGDSVTISGVGVAGYNGTYTITAIVSATQFQYTTPTSGLAASGSGTVATINSLARQRLNAFFARGGGFFSTNVSSGAFLTGATPSPLLTGTLTQSNTSAYGGIVRMDNPGTVNSPISGPEPSQDYYLIPSNMTYYSAIPTGAVVDEQYPANISTIGAANGFLAGLWGTTATPRSTAVNGKPILIHGATATGSRYMFMATDPTNKVDEQREWLYLVQDALWSNLTDEPTPSVSVTAPTGSANYNAGDALPVAWNTNGLVTKGQFSIWVVSSSNNWYGGKIVASSPTSASYSDSVTLNVPTGSGYSVYVFYRALPSDPWGVYGKASGTFSVTAAPVISVTAPTGSAAYNAGDSLPVTWNTDRLVASGEFSIWVVSNSNTWYSGKIVAVNPASTSYADSVTLNVPTGTGYHVYVFYRALPSDPWQDFGLASGTFSVTGPPVITMTAPTGSAAYSAGDTLPVTWTTDRLVASGDFSIWVVSSSNSWYGGKIVAANPASTSYADSVALNVPVGVGYNVYVFYRALPGDPWIDFGHASGTFSVF